MSLSRRTADLVALLACVIVAGCTNGSPPASISAGSPAHVGSASAPSTPAAPAAGPSADTPSAATPSAAASPAAGAAPARLRLPAVVRGEVTRRVLAYKDG